MFPTFTAPTNDWDFSFTATLPLDIQESQLTSEAEIWDRAAELYPDCDELITEWGTDDNGQVVVYAEGGFQVHDTPDADEAETLFWEYLSDDYNILNKHNTEITGRD